MDLTIPKNNFFSKVTDNPLYTIGVPFFSVNNKTLGTDGDSFTKVFILAELISIILDFNCLAAVF